MRPFRLRAPVASENDIEAGCKTILSLHKYLVIRNHAGTFQTLDCNRKIRGVPKGFPDYTCLHGVHRNFLLEVKRPGGELSDAQREQIDYLQFMHEGLPIAVVQSVDDLHIFLAQHERSP